MRQFQLITIGKLKGKQRYVAEAETEYIKRLARGGVRYAVIELPDGPASAPEAQRTAKEAEQLLKRIPPDAVVIALDETRGEPWDSQTLAKRLFESRPNGGYADSPSTPILLLVGGAYGFAETVFQRADACWRLSPLTLPHALARLVVAEQVYRAWTIATGHPYHHG